ncbi:MAG: zinc ribbon domain-containing protein [Candidatus Thermoplasmatota archaeon]|nr:zinc ribbon domain-containing protein [Candidatus Thermoplasmatota archaeon]
MRMVLGFGKRKCAECGSEIPANAKFCPNCRAMVKEVNCAQCGAAVKPGFKFCGDCGAPVSGAYEKETGITKWERSPGEFAVRHEVGDIKGFFRKGIVVEQGTKAMFIQDGRLSGVLPAGKYDAGGVLQRLKDLNVSGSSSVTLVDESDVHLDLFVPDLMTKENVRVGAKARVTLQLSGPEIFNVNFMKSRQAVSTHDLVEALVGEAKNELQSKVREHSPDELEGNAELKKELQQDFEYGMRTSLERMGVKLVQVPYVDYVFGEKIEFLRDEMEKRYVEEKMADMEKARVREGLEIEGVERGFERDEDWKDFVQATEMKKEWDNVLLDKKGEELDMYSKASYEAIMASTDDEDLRAHMAELKKQETLKDLSDEKILALAARESPEAAKAIAEKYKAIASEERINEQKEFMDRMERMSDRAIKEIGRTSEARELSKHPTTIVTSGPTVAGGKVKERDEETVRCKACNAESPVGSKYCIDCGGEL